MSGYISPQTYEKIYTYSLDEVICSLLDTRRVEIRAFASARMEYYRWPQNSESNKNTQQEKYETLLVGDDLGIIHKYDFEKFWHHCEFKNYGYDRVDDHYYNKYVQKPMLDCHIPEISKKFVED